VLDVPYEVQDDGKLVAKLSFNTGGAVSSWMSFEVERIEV